MLKRVATLQERINRDQLEVTQATERIIEKALIAFIKKYPQIRCLTWDQYAADPDGNGSEHLKIQRYEINIRYEKFVGYSLDDCFDTEMSNTCDVLSDEQHISCLEKLHPPMYKDIQELFTYLFELQPALASIYGNKQHIFVHRESFEYMNISHKAIWKDNPKEILKKDRFKLLFKGVWRWLIQKFKNLPLKKTVT